MNNLFNYNEEEIKPLMRLGDYVLGKYEKKPEPEFSQKTWDALDEFVKPKKKRGITSERQSIVKMFVDEINKEREGTEFKPVTGRGIAFKLTLLKTNQELYAFLSECKDYQRRNGSFGKRFFGGGKVKK
jgi:hypothetical protein